MTDIKRKQRYICKEMKRSGMRGRKLKEDCNILCIFLNRMHSCNYLLVGQIFYKWLCDFLYQMSLCRENAVTQGIERSIESIKTSDKLQVFRNEFCLHGPFSVFYNTCIQLVLSLVCTIQKCLQKWYVHFSLYFCISFLCL